MTRRTLLAALLLSLVEGLFMGRSHAALTAEPADVVLAHLGSFSSRPSALTGWTRYQEIAGFPFTDLYPVLVPTDLEDGRHVIRLYAGPFEALGEARDFCRRVEPETGYCRAVKFE